jgi:glutamyl-Q tRNA(Asp) synthetase
MIDRGRFAPSPTGALHFGSLVAALGSWLCARHAGAQWLVRMEDLDPPREVPGAAAAIITTLAAFSLQPDAPVLYQSSRHAAYQAAFEQLRAGDQVFPCWCSRSELAAAGGIHRDGLCVSAPDETRPPAWRLRMPDLSMTFDDALQGPQCQNLRQDVGDFVIRRVEGFYSYQLACVVDDAYQGITEVVRGHDLLDATPRQIHLQHLLELPTPRYRHLPLALDAHGRKLSKSGDAFPVDPTQPLPALRRALAFLGVPAGDAATPRELLAQALMRFDPAVLPRRPGVQVD